MTLANVLGAAPQNPVLSFFADEVGKKERTEQARRPAAPAPPAYGDVVIARLQSP